MQEKMPSFKGIFIETIAYFFLISSLATMLSKASLMMAQTSRFRAKAPPATAGTIKTLRPSGWFIKARIPETSSEIIATVP